VVGGGLVGAALALALGRLDLGVALVESNAPPAPAADGAWDSRIYTLSPGNAAWLDALEVWETVPRARVARVESMQIFGDRAPAHLEFSAYDAGLRELAWTVENGLLQDALWSALRSVASVAIFCPARCAALAWDKEAVRLTLADGRTLGARLIVGADGADSWVRECAGIPSTSHDYSQTGVVANFACERPHRATAFQWFRADGVLALLPLPGERVSMVWSAPEPRAQELMSAPADALAREVEAASALVLGRLEVTTAPAGFPLRRQRVARLIGPRLALIGDAAHNVHPLAGQGVNLGFRDARELASVLEGRGPQTDCGDHRLLRRYERARKEDIAVLELVTDGLEKLFSNRTVWLAGLRNSGLSLVDSQLSLKNLLIRHAAA
jgi:ubiquinone biosynthesis UbiH/UbiF/VisC/COQ6 family hydroxylase